jgi:N-acetylneuraminic acid mutarotase
MNNNIFKLNGLQLSLIAGGATDGGIGTGGRPLPAMPGPIGSIDDGSPYIGLGTGGRDWWNLPGDLLPPGDGLAPMPILKPEPGKP